MPYIWRAWITRKDGSRLYAKQFGKKAFYFWIEDKSIHEMEEPPLLKGGSTKES